MNSNISSLDDFICSQKKYFRLKEGAENELKRGMRKGYLRDTARIYKCNRCPGYHLSNGREDYKQQQSRLSREQLRRLDPVKVIANSFLP